ncbi:uncharacterized protein LOC111188514 [Astyanax mexicanus]|uniref:uncharacterized protein LOC111188514 n=1 Tax=Astyanax mexicanus TaxID=7994 RepID=UPI0020CB370C|nr:uncharacterized protein LOC111188514 [Astyanax mexicanus]
MPSCTSTLPLLLVSTTIIAVVESPQTPAEPVVKVKVHDSAALSCSKRCSGAVQWTLFSKGKDPLAECDQTSCRSVKEGYQMIFNQYLQGNLSLIITDVDFSKRGLYVCNCDNRDLCEVQLQIETLMSEVQITSGESLVMMMHISDEVEVIYRSREDAEQSSVQICSVNGESLKFNPEFTHRTSLSSALELRGGKVSDSGVYTVRDTRNDEVLHIYTVTFHSDSKAQDQIQKPSDLKCNAVQVWMVLLLVLLLAVCLVLVGVIVWLYRKNQHLNNNCLQMSAAQNNA